jgi:ABC-type dipeptide/oligopeptide/nickel transport system ATPase subunit
VILSVREFHKSYGNKKSRYSVVNNVSMTLYRGKTLGLIGESGSGKSTMAGMILNILERDSGEMNLTIDGSTTKNLTIPNKKIGAVLQDSTGSLNPKMNIQKILSEPLELVGVSNRHEIRSKINEMVKRIGLNEDLLTRYPYSLSGGQRQRVSLARAMMVNPRIIILDEPTSALDVKVQKKILELLKSLQKQKNLSYLFISHDLPVISEVADDIAVLYGGKIIEVGAAEKILNNPEQDYTKKLIKASTWTGFSNA